MKKIGLLGGTSWPSTIPYYEHLNRMAHEHQGGFHNARLALHNVNYHRMKSSYQTDGGWDKIPGLLNAEIDQLCSYQPDCIVICNNTLHKALDILQDQNLCQTEIPYIHIIDAVAKAAIDRKNETLLLLGTQFTMEDGFYARKLKNKYGLSIDIPNEVHRGEIQDMQTAISQGNIEESFTARFEKMLSEYRSYDGVILACTELPLAITAQNCPLPIIDPIYEQCKAAIDFAFS